MNHEEKEMNMSNKKHRRIVKNAMKESANLHNQLESSWQTLEFFREMIQKNIEEGEQASEERIRATSARIQYEVRMYRELGKKAEQLGKILNN